MELLDGCFLITSFVGQILSKVGLTVDIASISSAPSALHSSMFLTILGVLLIISGNSHVIYLRLYNCMVVLYLGVGLLGG